MKDEERDWTLYHMLQDGKPCRILELVRDSGFSREEVEASLERMENNCLICVMGESVSLLSLTEMMMINEMKYSPEMPVIIENGIIKVKKPDNE